MSVKSIAAFILFVLPSLAAATTPLLNDGWTSVRALGMGNAYTAVVNDADAIFYNPAAIARNTAFRWTVFDPRVGIDGVNTLSSVESLASSNNLASTIDGLYGLPIWAGGGAMTAIQIPGFEGAAYTNTEAGISLNNPADPVMDLNYYFDYGIALGTGFDLLPGVWKVGLVARRVNRTGTVLPVGAATVATLNTTTIQAQLKDRGTGYGLDAGTIFTIPGPISPSLSFVYRDVGMTSFSFDQGAAAPTPIQPEMVVGAGLTVHALLFSVTPAVDIRYADRADVQLGNKIHLGLEVGLPLLDLRVGLNQGYYTAGVGLDLGVLQLDLATYGVELGAYPGQLEDRRYVAQLTFDLGFDPGGGGSSGRHSDGSSSDGSSSSSSGYGKLKQRR